MSFPAERRAFFKRTAAMTAQGVNGAGDVSGLDSRPARVNDESAHFMAASNSATLITPKEVNQSEVAYGSRR